MIKNFFIAMVLAGLVFGGCSTASDVSTGEKKEYPFSAEAESKCQSAEKEIANKQYKTARQLLQQASSLTKNYAQQEKISFLIVECTFLSGYYNNAHKLYQNFLSAYSNTIRLNEVIKRELEIGFKFIEGAKRSLWGLYIIPSYDLGVKITRDTLQKYPYAEPSERYHFSLANHLFKLKNYEEALKEYENFIRIYPKSKLLAEAEYQMARTYLEIYQGDGYEMSPLLEAQKITSKFAKNYPDSPLNTEVEKLHREIHSLLARRDYKTALFYIKKGKLKSATLYLESVIKTYPDTEWAKESQSVLEGINKSETTR